MNQTRKEGRRRKADNVVREVVERRRELPSEGLQRIAIVGEDEVTIAHHIRKTNLTEERDNEILQWKAESRRVCKRGVGIEKGRKKNRRKRRGEERGGEGRRRGKGRGGEGITHGLVNNIRACGVEVLGNGAKDFLDIVEGHSLSHSIDQDGNSYHRNEVHETCRR